MTHELKITMKFEDGKPITSYNTVVSLDDKNIGYIQDLKLGVNCNEYFSKIEMSFPDPKLFGQDTSNIIENNINHLKKISNILINLKDINEF